MTSISVNWTLDDGPGLVVHKQGDPAMLTESTPAIYRRRDGDKRCTIGMYIHKGIRTILFSNAKSCEIYGERCGKSEYQGFAKAELDSTRRWKLEVAAKVSHMLPGFWLQEGFAPCLRL